MMRSGQSLEELYKSLAARPTHSMAALFVAAMREWKRSFESPHKTFAGLQMRIEKVMDVTIAREIERLERRLLVLATVGSAGPFIGLFGTVWGIIDAFHGLGTAGAATLRAVAPGISEALITTAAGLAAAIPAVIAYNLIGGSIRDLAARGDDFAMEVLNAVDRQQAPAYRTAEAPGVQR